LARHDYILANPHVVPLELVDPAGRMYQAGGKLRLRRTNPVTGLWDPVGVYTTGSLQLETWRPTALRAFLGFCAFVEVDTAAGDFVQFRLSTDEGVTALFWDGAAWRAPADDTEWNDEVEVDEGIGSFPIDCSFTTIVRLVTGAGSSTPTFEGYHVFWEARYDPTEDLLRSIHTKITSEVSVNAEFTTELVDPTVVVDLVDLVWSINSPVEVYHLTDDPCRRTNLLASYTATTVTLVSAQTGPIVVQFRGTPRSVHVASSDADFELQSLPAVVIQLVGQNRVRDFLVPYFEEPLRSRGEVLLRSTPARHTYVVRIACPAQYSLHDKKLADAVRRAFDEREWVRLLALDEDATLVGLETVGQTDRLPDQVFMRIVDVSVSVLEWLPHYRAVPMVTQIVARFRPIGYGLGAAAE
jgi:hypothetical protein